MKKLLMALAIATFTLGAMAQTATDTSVDSASESSSQGSSTDIMGAQEEVYPEGVGSAPGATDTSTQGAGDSTMQEEENVDDPSLNQDSTTIQEEVDSESEDTMRSDTMEGSQSPQGTDDSSQGSSTP